MPDELMLNELNALIRESITEPAFRDALDAAARVRPIGPTDKTMIQDAITAGLHRWRVVLTALLQVQAEHLCEKGSSREESLRRIRELLRVCERSVQP